MFLANSWLVAWMLALKDREASANPKLKASTAKTRRALPLLRRSPCAARENSEPFTLKNIFIF